VLIFFRTRLTDASGLSIRIPARSACIFRNRPQSGMAAHTEAQVFLKQDVVKDT
jgi:hypothetical protein